MVWPPGVEPLPPEPYSGRGRPPVRPRETAQRKPVKVKELAFALPQSAFQTVCWREGTNVMLSGRFAAVRVRHAGGDRGRARLHPEQWLLIEWPAEDVEPLKYFLSTLPPDITLGELVAKAHMRWRIERDHIVAKMNKAIDEVRADETRRMSREGYEPVLKKSRWCLLKRRENLTDKQRLRMRDLLQYNLRTVRAWLFKEEFQQLWDYI